MIYWEKKGGKWEEGAQERERKEWNAIGESLCLLRYFQPFHELSILSPSVSVHPCFLSSPFSPPQISTNILSSVCNLLPGSLLLSFVSSVSGGVQISSASLSISVTSRRLYFLISAPLFPFLLAPLSIILPQPVQFIDLVRQCSITATQSNIWYS